MFVTIDLPDDLEKFLQTHAQRVGVPVETLLTRTIVERWVGVRQVPGLLISESDLLLRLQNLFPPEETREYLTLCDRSDNEILTESDQVRLRLLIEQRDYRNAERLRIVAELAGLRGISLRETMQQLGIRPD